MKTNKMLSVKFQGNLVGTLASREDGKIAVEYADRWLKTVVRLVHFRGHWKKRYLFQRSNIF